MFYKQHEFYKTNGLSLEDKINILNDAYSLNNEWWVDQLDISKSHGREIIEMSYEDVIKHFNDSCHFVVIQRNGYDEPYGEIGFCTMGKKTEYFLWVILNLENLYYITEKYNMSL